MGTSAHAASGKAVPDKEDLQRLIRDFKVQPPGFAVPNIDPENPQIPPLPYVAVPPGVRPATGFLSPAAFVICQAAYLGPIGGVVALTVVMDQLPDNALPIQPSFLNPVISPVNTACVLSPFPRFTECKQDAAIRSRLEGQSDTTVPGVGGLPSVNPFSYVPAPFASVVVEVDALQKALSYYALNRQPIAADPTGKLATQLSCR